MWILKRPVKIRRDGKMVSLNIGDPCPEAGTWKASWLRHKKYYVEWVEEIKEEIKEECDCENICDECKCENEIDENVENVDRENPDAVCVVVKRGRGRPRKED